jgi:hypothetical protein
MKPGFYVGIASNSLYLKLENSDAGVDIVDLRKFPQMGERNLSAYRPATRQDIIDKLLPLIPEKKEPGQVAYEAYKGPSWWAPWEQLSGNPEAKESWAAVERAVLEAHSK